MITAISVYSKQNCCMCATKKQEFQGKEPKKNLRTQNPVLLGLTILAGVGIVGEIAYHQWKDHKMQSNFDRIDIYQQNTSDLNQNTPQDKIKKYVSNTAMKTERAVKTEVKMLR
jgi:hypothetical protein